MTGSEPTSAAHGPRAQDIISEARGPHFETDALAPTLVAALLQARGRYGGRRVILEDHDRKPLTYNALITAAHALAIPLSRFAAPGEPVGVMLPTSTGAIVTFFALLIGRRTPAMLNFTAGERAVRAACALAGARVILTSRRFLHEARLKPLAAALQHDFRIVELEEIRDALSPLDKLQAFASARMPRLLAVNAESGDPAAIVFTSGTTGEPKGVVLSHANLIANVEQCRLHTAFDPDWVFFNTLPVFHAFGLTGGALLPILSGLKAVLYPSPLHRARVAALIEATRANVLISTDTFAAHYARAARPGALAGLKLAVLGAEKVREETRNSYARNSGATVLEGYGVTECSPVVAVNRPGANRPGTVGTLLPGIEARIVRVPGIGDGGQLFIRGPNVMKGYLRPGAPGGIDPPPEGWFDTGDLATLSVDGFLIITGRLKRFVRIGAEMVSLFAIEQHAQSVWHAARHAAVAAPGRNRPEEVVLVTDQQNATLDPLLEWARSSGVRSLELPQRIIVVDRVPTLPTGKVDYAEVRRLAEKPLASRAQSNA